MAGSILLKCIPIFALGFAGTMQAEDTSSANIMAIQQSQTQKLKESVDTLKSGLTTGISTNKLTLAGKWSLSDTGDDWIRVYGAGTNTYGGGIAADHLWSRTMYIGNGKWVMKDTGDDWLRLYDNAGSTYYGGFAANKLWGMEHYIGGKWLLKDTGDDWLRVYNFAGNDYYGGVAASRLWSQILYIGGGKWSFRDKGEDILRLYNSDGTGYLGGFGANILETNALRINLYRIEARTERVDAGIFTRKFYFFDSSGNPAGLEGAYFQQKSDRRLKEDIRPLTGSLDKVMNLKPVSYTWKSDAAHSKDVGFVAQDVQEVFPEVVSPSDDGTLGVRYTNLIAPLTQAVQEQQKLIQELRAEIEELKKAQSPRQ